MDLDRAALLEVFLAESEENLGSFERSLLDLERRPGDAEALSAAFRAVHTLKGNAASLGFAGASAVAHAAEDVLDRVRRREVAIAPELVTLLLAARDAIREALADPGDGGGEARQARHDLLIADLVRRAGAGTTPSPAPTAGLATESRTDSPRAAGAGAALRVEVGRLDSLLALVGEIAVSRLRLEHLLERLGPDAHDVLDAHRDADRMHAALQAIVFKMRLVPLGPVFRQYERTVRDLAASHGKQVALEVEGEDVEVDTSIVELVRDALLHAIRNAIDHGIEPPAERMAVGKDPVGRIRLSAHHDCANVVIEVADDGAGLRRDRIRARALEAGLVRDDTLLSDAELLELVFLPGFTTAAAVTRTSGRGVGMDVVRRNVERVRGTVRIDSVEGASTSVTLRMPLTVFALEALQVRVGQETYVLPMEDVTECLDHARDEGLCGAEGGVIELRGRPVPYIRLRSVLGVPGPVPARENVVVVRQDRGEAGFAVDAVLGSGPAVIRRLGRLLRRAPGIAGSVILGSGEVALVLDVAALLKQALRRERAPAAQGV